MSPIDENYTFSEKASRIIAWVIEMNKTLRNGFQEVIYRRALALEFKLKGIGFAREKEMYL